MTNRSSLLLAACALFWGNELRADVADVLPVGDLERWGALSLGLNGRGDRLFNSAFIDGDLAAAGVGNIVLTNGAVIQGDVYDRHMGVIRLDPGAGITGREYQDQDALLNQEASDALAFSEAADSLASTRNYDLINLRGSDSLALTGVPGETVVLNLRSFAMSGNSILTLDGAANTTFVINVNKGFSLTNAARIVLSGGLDWNDVVFNVCGRHGKIQISGTAIFQGILLATRRTVCLRDSALVRGEVIADALTVRGASWINHPPIVSP